MVAKLSVVTTWCNRAELAAAIEHNVAVLGEVLVEWEILVVNGGGDEEWFRRCQPVQGTIAANYGILPQSRLHTENKTGRARVAWPDLRKRFLILKKSPYNKRTMNPPLQAL